MMNLQDRIKRLEDRVANEMYYYIIRYGSTRFGMTGGHGRELNVKQEAMWNKIERWFYRIQENDIAHSVDPVMMVRDLNASYKVFKKAFGNISVPQVEKAIEVLYRYVIGRLGIDYEPFEMGKLLVKLLKSGNKVIVSLNNGKKLELWPVAMSSAIFGAIIVPVGAKRAPRNSRVFKFNDIENMAGIASAISAGKYVHDAARKR